MSSQHLSGGSTWQLDAYLYGIRQEFDRLNHELDEARKQRDEYKVNYQNQEKELRDLITSLLHRLDGKDRICQHCNGDSFTGLVENDVSMRSPASSSPSESPFDAHDRMDSAGNSKGISPVEEGRDQDGDVRDGAISVKNEDRPPSGFASPPIGSNIISTNEVGKSTWDIECNDGDTEIGLKLDLAYELTQECGTRFAFSPDGKYLATAFRVVRIFDVNTGRRISVMGDLYGRHNDVSNECLSFSPNNNYLAAGGNGRVTIWIISQRRVRNVFRFHDYIRDLSFSPNEQHLVTCSFDRTVRISRLRDGFSRVLTVDQWQLPIAARFSPDGRYVASGSNAGEILIWNVHTGRLVAEWRGHRRRISNLMFTSDGKGLLTGSWDKTVVCWDVAWLSSLGIIMEGEHWQYANSIVTGISRAGHTDGPFTVSISSDGKRITSGSDDETVMIWNAHDGTPQCIPLGPDDVLYFAFSPDGTYLAIGGWSPPITIWKCSNL